MKNRRWHPPLQYSCLENPMDGGAWEAAVHGVTRSWTRLSDFTFTFHFHALEKEMAIHSSVLAWRIPGMVGPGGLPSLGSHRVGHDWSDLAAVAAAEHSWHCLSLGLEWKLIISSPVATAEFSKFAGILSAALSQHHLLGFEIAQLEFHHLH